MMYILQGRGEGTGLQVGGMADASVFEPRSGGYDPHKTCSAGSNTKRNQDSYRVCKDRLFCPPRAWRLQRQTRRGSNLQADLMDLIEA